MLAAQVPPDNFLYLNGIFLPPQVPPGKALDLSGSVSALALVFNIEFGVMATVGVLNYLHRVGFFQRIQE